MNLKEKKTTDRTRDSFSELLDLENDISEELKEVLDALEEIDDPEDRECPSDSPDLEAEQWDSVMIRMPSNFRPLFDETLKGYKELLQTDKTFPAVQAIIAEGWNSLKQHKEM